MPDYRNFTCPDNPYNRQQHIDLEDLKKNGWQVIDAGRDPVDPNVMIITLSGTGGTRGGTRTVRTTATTAPKAKSARRAPKTKKPKKR